MKYFFALVLIICSSFQVFGAPNESISTNEIFVGDEFQYSINFPDELPDTILYPTGEFYEVGEELPLFKVLEVRKDAKKLSLSLRFYSSGEFILPITWQENSQKKNSDFKIRVQSRLTGAETDIEDIDPPISFEGSYLYRLFFAGLLFLVLLYLVYAMIVFWKKQTKIVNAQWETIPELELRTKKLLQLEECLKTESIIFKDFCYLFSSYCKEEYSHRLRTNLLHLTDSNFLAYLYDHSGLEESDLRDMRNIFRNIKYSDHSKLLSQDEAKTLWLEWKSKLKI